MSRLLPLMLLLAAAGCGLEQGSGSPCTIDGECTGGEACDVGLGLCVVACDPIEGAGCEEGFGCRLRTVDSVAGVCRLDEGITLGPGDACGGTADCPFGTICGGGRCVRLCDGPGEMGVCPASEDCVNVDPLAARYGVCLR
ncbi:MAG: hypothetical protein AAGH15_20550 [Myxococcota bacterium]